MTMRWGVLITSSVLEAVWANALGASHALTLPVPTLIALFGVAASVAGLAYALQTIPTSVAYGVWTGIGAVLTVAVAVGRGNETLSLAKVVLLTVIVAAVIGLRLLDRPPKADHGPTGPAPHPTSARP